MKIMKTTMVKKMGSLVAVAGASAALLAAEPFIGGQGCIPSSGDALPNPERGFRFEKQIAIEPNVRNTTMRWPLDSVEKRYKAVDGVVVVQAYCYLAEYCDCSIPQMTRRADSRPL